MVHLLDPAHYKLLRVKTSYQNSEVVARSVAQLKAGDRDIKSLRINRRQFEGGVCVTYEAELNNEPYQIGGGVDFRPESFPLGDDTSGEMFIATNVPNALKRRLRSNGIEAEVIA